MDYHQVATITLFALALLLLVAYFVISAIARSVKEPMMISVLPLADPLEANPELTDFIRRTTDQLSWLEFSKQLDFTVPEVPHRTFCRLMSFRNGEHTVLVQEVYPDAAGRTGQPMAPIAFIEFQTVLDTGSKINTNNSPLRNPLLTLPDYLVTSYPHVEHPRDLFDLHIADMDQVRTRKGGRIKPQRLQDFAQDLTREWCELMEYQVKAGLLRVSPDGRFYVGRPKLVLNYMFPGLVGKPKEKAGPTAIRP